MNKNKIISLVILIIAAALGCILYTQYFNNKNTLPANITSPTNETSTNLVVYSNSDLGFNFSMPESWKGYSVVNNTWEGNSLKANESKQTGTKLLIRNPKWTATLPYQDIPVIVFTLNQWDLYTAGNFSISAAPFPASELGRNNVYVFALPPRWDFEYNKGYEEAQNIIKSSPLKTFGIIIKT